MSSTIWFTPWKPGPAADLAPKSRDSPDSPESKAAGAAVVSVTEFTPHRPWTSFGVNVAGVALRRVWQDIEGAVGLWLWVDPDPLRPRSGSVSVWRDEKDLQGFVARHDHVRVVRSYRHRGAMRSTTWRTECFSPDATQEAARSFLTGKSAWPG
ncbi:hypothetical protein [Streptomyces sp. NPDC050704]|uniref:hypothetical protein n=1 Tax=Streptomyces sp. NPDC050704 TaxID=3157219 RepID=UPI0034300A3F